MSLQRRREWLQGMSFEVPEGYEVRANWPHVRRKERESPYTEWSHCAPCGLFFRPKVARCFNCNRPVRQSSRENYRLDGTPYYEVSRWPVWD